MKLSPLFFPFFSFFFLQKYNLKSRRVRSIKIRKFATSMNIRWTAVVSVTKPTRNSPKVSQIFDYSSESFTFPFSRMRRILIYRSGQMSWHLFIIILWRCVKKSYGRIIYFLISKNSTKFIEVLFRRTYKIANEAYLEFLKFICRQPGPIYLELF